MFDVPVGAIAECSIYNLLNQTHVFRMSSFKNQFKRRAGLPAVFEDAKRLVRPDQFTCGWTPAKTSRVAEPLRFRQIGFLGMQGLVEIAQCAGRIVEGPSKMSKLVLARYRNLMVK